VLPLIDKTRFLFYQKKKGVLQGCSISPILFNLFIHDIFDVCENLGVNIYELNVTKSSTPKYCCNGFFADDIVICAPFIAFIQTIFNLILFKNFYYILLNSLYEIWKVFIFFLISIYLMLNVVISYK